MKQLLRTALKEEKRNGLTIYYLGFVRVFFSIKKNLVYWVELKHLQYSKEIYTKIYTKKIFAFTSKSFLSYYNYLLP